MTTSTGLDTVYCADCIEFSRDIKLCVSDLKGAYKIKRVLGLVLIHSEYHK